MSKNSTERDRTAREGAAVPITPRRRRGRQNRTLEEQYSYVIGDLKRLFAVAAVMFALLIALNLLLR